MIPESGKQPLSIVDFIEQVNASLLEHQARVLGEITKISKPYPFGYFFSIKDKEGEAVLECFINATNYRRNGTVLKMGTEVIVTGQPQVRAAKGTFSFQTTTIELVGDGKLQQEYEALKKKLEAEGLFTNKRPLPDFPHKIGVITSKAGDVIHDFETNIGRYGFEIQFVDSRVEGKDAIHELLAAIATLARRDIDILVIMKGGGSLESFQAFNTESVVRAIAAFPKPVITGIGHEPDITLSQLAADYGASTPSIAAKKLNETWEFGIQQVRQMETSLLSRFKHVLVRVNHTLDRASSAVSERLNGIEKEITRMKNSVQTATSLMRIRISQHAETINLAKDTMARVWKTGTRSIETTLENFVGKVFSAERQGIEDVGTELTGDIETILRPFAPAIANMAKDVSTYERQVKAYNPERNLSLGYSLAYSQGKLVRSVKQLKKGDTVDMRLSDGSFTSEVEGIKC